MWVIFNQKSGSNFNQKFHKTTQEVKARTILNDLFNIGIDSEDKKIKL